MIRCSVCIPTYKRPAQLNMLLANLFGIHSDRVSEIIIAVSGTMAESTDINTKHLLRMFELENIKYTIKDGFTGTTGAKCWFKEVACEPILGIIDDDAILSSNYFDLLDEFDDPSVGAISGCIHTPVDIGHYRDYSYEPIETPQITKVNRIYINPYTNLVDFADKYQVYYFKDKTQKFECDCLQGTAFFVRNCCYRIDMNYARGAENFEETDSTYNIVQMGRKCIFSSAATAFHLRGETGGERARCNGNKQKDVNSNYFIRKWNIKHEYTNTFVVAVDFDNTLTQNSTFEKTGAINPQAINALRCLQQNGCVLVLWTTREGQDLVEARNLCEQHGLYFDYFNEYPLRKNSRKIDVDFMIDDKSVVQIDWENIIKYIIKKKQEKLKQNESNKNSKI